MPSMACSDNRRSGWLHSLNTGQHHFGVFLPANQQVGRAGTRFELSGRMSAKVGVPEDHRCGLGPGSLIATNSLGLFPSRPHLRCLSAFSGLISPHQTTENLARIGPSTVEAMDNRFWRKPTYPILYRNGVNWSIAAPPPF